MAITSFTPSNREAWLAIRKKYVTATDSVAIENLVSWADPLSVLQDKRGLIPPPKMNRAMLIGQLLEPLIRDWYEKTRGIQAWETKGERIWVDDGRNLACTPDGIAFLDGGQRRLLEIKTSERGWKELPRRVAVQVIHQAALTLPDEAEVAHLEVPDHIQDELVLAAATGQPLWLPGTPEVIPVPLDKEEIACHAAKMAAWYEEHVLLGMPLPEQVPPMKEEKPKGIVEEPQLAEEWKELKAAASEAEERAKELKAKKKEIEDRMAELLGREAFAIKGAGYQISRAVVNGSLKVDHAGILAAVLLKKPELAELVREIEPAFISYGGGYSRWTLKKEK